MDSRRVAPTEAQRLSKAEMATAISAAGQLECILALTSSQSLQRFPDKRLARLRETLKVEERH